MSLIISHRDNIQTSPQLWSLVHSRKYVWSTYNPKSGKKPLGGNSKCKSLKVQFCCTNVWTPIKAVMYLSPGLLQGSMMSSMIYTQGHIGEEIYKLPELLTSLPNRGQKSNGNKCEMTKIRLFFLFLSPIHFTVFITAERRSCDTTPSQLALNGDSMVHFNLIDYVDSTGHADTEAWYTWYATQEVRFLD